MTPRRFKRLLAILERRQPDLTVLTDNVHKSHNISAIMRTCDAVGIPEIHAVWPDPSFRPEPTSASGAQRYVRVRTHPDLETAFLQLAATGVQIVAAHPDDRAIDFRQVDYCRSTALLLGSERDGLSAEARARVATFIAIPMLGAGKSLNVSVAAAVILFEAQRQRLAAGFYDRSRLEARAHQRILFEWAYPKLAEHCRRKDLAYPRLGLEGELLDSLPRS